MFDTTNNPPFPAGKVSNDLDGFNQGEGDAEGRGGDHRPVQDNGTGGRTSNVAGENTFRGDYPLPKDVNASYPAVNPDFSAGTINEFGFDQGNSEVGCDSTINGYGITGPAAGGGVKKNTTE